MAAQLKNPSIQLVVLVLAVLLLSGFAIGISAANAGPADARPETGQFDVDGVAYRFAPTTCTITDNDFLAAGPGEVDGEPFWISASADRVDLTVGQDSGLQRPADDQLWLISVAEVSWEVDDDFVTASAVVRDERDPNSPSYRGSLSFSCPAV